MPLSQWRARMRGLLTLADAHARRRAWRPRYPALAGEAGVVPVRFRIGFVERFDREHSSAEVATASSADRDFLFFLEGNRFAAMNEAIRLGHIARRVIVGPNAYKAVNIAPAPEGRFVQRITMSES